MPLQPVTLRSDCVLLAVREAVHREREQSRAAYASPVGAASIAVWRQSGAALWDKRTFPEPVVVHTTEQ